MQQNGIHSTFSLGVGFLGLLFVMVACQRKKGRWMSLNVRYLNVKVCDLTDCSDAEYQIYSQSAPTKAKILLFQVQSLTQMPVCWDIPCDKVWVFSVLTACEIC